MREEFTQPAPMIFGIFFGLVLIFISTLSMLFVPVYLAILGYLLAITVPLLIFLFASRQTLVCTEEGFTLEKSSRRKGSETKFFPWSSVTSTRYYEIVLNKMDNRTSTSPYFEVECGGERVMKMGRLRRFPEMVRIFNQRTPHLPYSWEPRVGMTISFGSRRSTFSREAFVKTERAGVPRSGATPPPMPGAAPVVEEQATTRTTPPPFPSGPPPMPDA